MDKNNLINMVVSAMDKKDLFKRAVIIGILLMIVGNAVAQEKVTGRINCVVCKVAQIFFLITALIAGIVILMAGIKWVGSPDDPAARGAARLTIIHTVIGLIIIIVAVFLISYISTDVLPQFAAKVDPAGWVGGCTDECSFT